MKMELCLLTLFLLLLFPVIFVVSYSSVFLVIPPICLSLCSSVQSFSQENFLIFLHERRVSWNLKSDRGGVLEKTLSWACGIFQIFCTKLQQPEFLIESNGCFWKILFRKVQAKLEFLKCDKNLVKDIFLVFFCCCFVLFFVLFFCFLRVRWFLLRNILFWSI